VDIVKTTLDNCPPELASDVMDRGIALAGDGALLRGLGERLGEETAIPVYLADNPLEPVVLGTGRCVEDFDALQKRPAGRGYRPRRRLHTATSRMNANRSARA
jgi:rod shape-determining protein MreB